MDKVVSNMCNLTEENHHIVNNLLLNHMADLIFIVKVDKKSHYRYIFINEAGLKKEKLIGNYCDKKIIDVHGPKKGKKIERKYNKVISRRATVNFIEKSDSNKGETFYYDCKLTPIFDENNDIIYIIETSRNVTKLVSKSVRLYRKKQSYQSIVEHNMDGILHINLNGVIINSNPAIRKITGYTKKQIVRRSFYNLVPDNELSMYKDFIERAKKGETLESFDCRFIHRNGQAILLQLKMIPIVVDVEVRGIYITLRDISEQAKQAEDIKYLAFHDQLTGLLNRRALFKDLQSILNRAKENDTEVAILSIDLDRFKQLNDTLGHSTGDKIIKMISERFLNCLPTNGYAYRHSGDEFIIVLENSSEKDATRYSEYLLKQFSEVFYCEGNELYISISIGISIFPHDGLKEEVLLKNADIALFQVKEQGRAHYQLYRDDMEADNKDIVKINTHLRKAIDNNELSLHFQPQVHLKSKDIDSFEALLRWNSPILGLVSPAKFIPLAEDTGLINPIGEWVINETCKHIKRWKDKGFTGFRIAINISPRQFDQNLIKTLENAINYYKISPSSIEIEITEGVLRDVDEAIPILNQIKELGITISVDDFGTGYSSLNYLKSFPINILKIDRTFIKDIVDNPRDAAIATTIIHLGRSLGMKVIAEGVETKEQAAFLRENHCHKAQGFYFSKPLQTSEIDSLLAENIISE